MRSVREEAARWFARMANTPPDDPARGPFEVWLAASPAHAAEYAAFASLWEDFDTAKRVDALANAVEQRRQALAREEETRRAARRRFVTRGTLGVFLCGGAGALAWRGYSHWQAQPLHRLALATATAQLARQALPDGSTALLNARTALAATYYRDRREVRLGRGEAIFEVVRDQDRPFIVDTDLARITVLGTRFVVSCLADSVRVAVAHGRVSVASHGDLAPRPLELEAGEVAEVVSGAAPQRVARTAADAFAWESGTLVFDHATLGEIADSLSRYRAVPVRAVASGGRVTAVVQIADIEHFLKSLPSIAPVRIEAGSHETRILPR